MSHTLEYYIYYATTTKYAIYFMQATFKIVDLFM